MRNIKLIIEYDGTNFFGWQIQKGKRTVQGVMEEAIFKITGERVRVSGASRTDAGVHSLGQVANFRTNASYSADVFKKALNAVLPEDVAVLSAQEVNLDFNARRDAIAKLYLYLIYNNNSRRVLLAKYYWHIKKPLKLDAMTKACTYLIGKHDFTSFRALSCEAKNPVRELKRLEIKNFGEKYIAIILEANAFLQHMARNIVGTLVAVGIEKIKAETVKEILEAKDRTKAGPTAPPNGLFLLKVSYKGG